MYKLNVLLICGTHLLYISISYIIKYYFINMFRCSIYLYFFLLVQIIIVEHCNKHITVKKTLLISSLLNKRFKIYF